jgi:hypothetical protein
VPRFTPPARLDKVARCVFAWHETTAEHGLNMYYEARIKTIPELLTLLDA